MAEEVKKLTSEELAEIMEMMMSDLEKMKKPTAGPTELYRSKYQPRVKRPTRGIREIERNPLENLLNQIIQNTFNPIEEMIKEQNTYKEMKEAGLPLAGKSEQDNINILMNFIKSAPFAGLMRKIRGMKPSEGMKVPGRNLTNIK